MPSTGNIPLSNAIPGELISSGLWNTEFQNINSLMTPAGLDTYSGTDAQMQIQTNPYPGSVTSHATSTAGELERLRYMISQITGNTYWYQPASSPISTLATVALPVGGVIDYPSATPPNSNFALANGSAINRTTYATLFTLIGTTFGVGDGTTTFNLPNYTDRMSITAGNLYSVAATGGSPTHTLIDAELPATAVTVNITDPHHTHTATDSGHTHGVTDPGHTHTERMQLNSSGSTTSPASTSIATSIQNSIQTGSSTTGLTVNSGTANVTNSSVGTGITASGNINGSGTAHNILNPYLAMFKMMRIL